MANLFRVMMHCLAANLLVVLRDVVELDPVIKRVPLVCRWKLAVSIRSVDTTIAAVGAILWAKVTPARGGRT